MTKKADPVPGVLRRRKAKKRKHVVMDMQKLTKAELLKTLYATLKELSVARQQLTAYRQRCADLESQLGEYDRRPDDRHYDMGQ